ncbi:hypothetical protein DINM_002564 [Dirofilaria immitis]|nr:hypothetical protein [Dirofilaria immitis]
MNCKTAIVDFTELFCRAMNEAIDSLGLTGAACYSLEQFPDALIVRVGWCINDTKQLSSLRETITGCAQSGTNIRCARQMRDISLGSLEIAKEIYGTEKELEGVPEAEIIGKRL